MKRLIEKVIEAGIVPKQAVELAKLWGVDQLSPDFDSKRQQTEACLAELVREIVQLIEEESEVPEIRETELDIAQLFKDSAVTVRVLPAKNECDAFYSAIAAIDRFGRFVFDRTVIGDGVIELGARIIKDSRVYEVKSIETRYINDKPVYDVCSVMEVGYADM
jgi:hypothetical protein